jgi:hypothetical protein
VHAGRLSYGLCCTGSADGGVCARACVSRADANHQALEADQAEAEARLAKVKKAKETAAAALSSMKASGLGGVELNREMYMKLEEEILEAKAALKVTVVCLCRSLSLQLSLHSCVYAVSPSAHCLRAYSCCVGLW